MMKLFKKISQAYNTFSKKNILNENGDVDTSSPWFEYIFKLNNDVGICQLHIKEGLRIMMLKAEKDPPSLPVFLSYCKNYMPAKKEDFELEFKPLTCEQKEKAETAKEKAFLEINAQKREFEKDGNKSGSAYANAALKIFGNVLSENIDEKYIAEAEQYLAKKGLNNAGIGEELLIKEGKGILSESEKAIIDHNRKMNVHAFAAWIPTLKNHSANENSVALTNHAGSIPTSKRFDKREKNAK